MTVKDTKSLIRGRLRRARNASTSEYRRFANEAIRDLLSGVFVDRSVSTIGVYLPYGGEADPLPNRSAWVSQGLRFPRVGPDSTLSFHAVDSEDELVSGYRGILEPNPKAPKVSLESLDVILVPGLAFDRDGMRLGQGGGFYDRLLARQECPFSIGVAFAAQVLPSIPKTPLDRPVNLVVTELGIARSGQWISPSRR